jgi:ABC-type transport system substrate-binding protein
LNEKLRVNPRKAWYRNLEEVTTNGDYEVTFHLKRPQPAFIALLASGFSPVYPCHVSAFVAGKVDMTSPYYLQVPVLKDLKDQAPEATCELVPVNVNRNVMMNREAPPFNNPDLRRAIALSLDRKASTPSP